MKSRQRPGAACEECRRRKLRCNGAEPQCSVCADAGVDCVVVRQRAARGPKKGYLKVLKDRITILESQLRASQMAAPAASNIPHGDSTSNMASSGTTQVTHEITSDDTSFASPQLASMAALMPSDSREDGSTYSNFINLPQAFNKDFLSMTACTPFSNPVSNASVLDHSYMSPPLSSIMKAELNQLFFDRVHSFVPILHQHSYFRKAKQTETRSDSHICLQYSMWSLASLMSAHLQHLQEPFYLDAKYMLGNLDLLPNIVNDDIQTEIAQSWVLIAVFESIKANHRQAWSSAGRAFRLVQLMRLHELDVPPIAENCSSQNEVVAQEERRRLLWMAYLLDHLFCMRNNWPITLSAHAIQTRLPATEEDFQGGKGTTSTFLSDVMGGTYTAKTSTFNECLVLASLCERSPLHRHPNGMDCQRAQKMSDWTDQYPGLDDILDSQLQMLSDRCISPNQVYDPMLLFAHIMSQATIIYIARNSTSMTAQPMGLSSDCINAKVQQRALAAADHIITLSKSLADFHTFKTHPLTPIPLFVSIEFLYANRSASEQFSARLQELRGVFQELKSINNPSQSYMDLLGLSCTPTAIEITAS